MLPEILRDRLVSTEQQGSFLIQQDCCAQCIAAPLLPHTGPRLGHREKCAHFHLSAFIQCRIRRKCRHKDQLTVFLRVGCEAHITSVVCAHCDHIFPFHRLLIPACAPNGSGREQNGFLHVDLSTILHVKRAAYNILRRHHGHLKSLGQFVVIFVLYGAFCGCHTFCQLQKVSVLTVNKVRHLQRIFINFLLQRVRKSLLKGADVFQRCLSDLMVDHEHRSNKNHKQWDGDKRNKCAVIDSLQRGRLAFPGLHS